MLHSLGWAVLSGMLCTSQGTQAPQAQQLDCTWLVVDSAARTATLQVIAGHSAANQGLNFNGFQNGRLTLSVPLNWNVVLRFVNRDTLAPHSVEVIDSTRTLPGGPVDPAFPRAQTTRLMQGLAAGQTEEIRFAASRAGTFYIWCAVPGHGIGGMWIRFRVSRTDARPLLVRSSS
jgi:hypothetical protein